MTYDSTAETKAHIWKVRENLHNVIDNLDRRALDHDFSKLQDPEKAYFDEWTPRLRDVVYDSPEYHSFLEALKPALDHHYAVNDHHPEHYPLTGGVEQMSLMAMLEMLADWKAAAERTKDGNLRRSIEINIERFQIPLTIQKQLWNTAEELGWL